MADNIQDLIISLDRLTTQMGRLVSDFESEKGLRKERNAEINERLERVEAWKNKWHGALVAMSILLTLLTVLSFVVKIKP